MRFYECALVFSSNDNNQKGGTNNRQFGINFFASSSIPEVNLNKNYKYKGEDKILEKSKGNYKEEKNMSKYPIQKENISKKNI